MEPGSVQFTKFLCSVKRFDEHTRVRRFSIDNTDPTRELIECIIEYTSSANEPFTLAEVVNTLILNLDLEDDGDLVGLVEEALLADPWIFYDAKKALFLPRVNFFKGKKFLIAPTALERKEGILIPGHRFIPFVQRYLPPSNFTVRYGDHQLTYKRVTLSMSQLQVFYSLFDYSRTIEFMVMDDETNAEVLLKAHVEPGEMINLWVLDMKELYQNLATNGMLLLTVDNWRDGTFTLEPFNQFDGPGSRKKQEHWCKALEHVLIQQVFDELGPMTDLNEQLAWAFFHGPASLWQAPQIHIGGFLKFLKNTIFTRVNGVPLFWRKGESPEDVIFEHLKPSIPLSGITDTIDSILHDIGCSLRESDIEAYMRDELFQGNESLDQALERALHNRGTLHFADDFQEEAFDALIENLWKTVLDSYNRFSDQRAGKCRTECLAIMDKVVEWMNQLDNRNIGMDALPKKEFVAISSLVTMLTHTVSALNQRPQEISMEEINALHRALGPLRTQADQLMMAIDVKLFPPASKKTAPKRPVFRVIQGGLANSDEDEE